MHIGSHEEAVGIFQFADRFAIAIASAAAVASSRREAEPYPARLNPALPAGS